MFLRGSCNSDVHTCRQSYLPPSLDGYGAPKMDNDGDISGSLRAQLTNKKGAMETKVNDTERIKALSKLERWEEEILQLKAKARTVPVSTRLRYKVLVGVLEAEFEVLLKSQKNGKDVNTRATTNQNHHKQVSDVDMLMFEDMLHTVKSEIIAK